MPETPENSVASPCINVCTIDEDSGLCLGCARNIREVARWKRLSDEERRQVINQLPERKRKMRAAGADCRWRDE